MRVLIVGAGGVGSALATICARRDAFEHIVVADVDPSRAARAATTAHSDRVSSTRVDASARLDVVELAALQFDPIVDLRCIISRKCV